MKSTIRYEDWWVLNLNYQILPPQVKVTFENAAQEIIDSNDTFPRIDPNTATEDTSDIEETEVVIRTRLSRGRQKLAKKHRNNTKNLENFNDLHINQVESSTKPLNHSKRHAHKKFLEKQQQLYKLQQLLRSDEEIDLKVKRPKRNTQRQKLDGGIEHGGNALNYSYVESDESSVSSFETNLLTCYDGQILLTRGFPPSTHCTDVHYLEKGGHLEAVHDVLSDGYYYYIFYSDNDYIYNDIHAVFDIYKPTYRYTNSSKTKECINSTECVFPIHFWSDETVIVEVPTRDGIEHEEDDITFLLSTCQPRMSVYIVFPISVLFLILGCAFL